MSWRSVGRWRPAAVVALAVLLVACGGGDAPPRAGAERPGRWEEAGVLNAARGGHTATVLQDGRVLVAGGAEGNDDAPFASAELFDPVTGTWKATADMAERRVGHTATLLPDGMVLVTGGLRLATAEVYDPAAGTWTAAGTMGGPRSAHTATLLPDGMVLVAGGFPSADTAPATTAELFDPAARTWTATGSMAAGRGYHAATPLPTGRVLVSAGNANTSTRRVATGTTTSAPLGAERSSGGGEIATAELYDPASRTWSAAAPLGTARSLHTATALADGRVLVTGGVSPAGELDSAELYDTGAATWAAAAPMPTARATHTATLLPDGRVLVAGGRSGGGGSILASTLPSAGLFDGATGKWTPVVDMSSPRFAHAAALVPGGKVLVVGGLTPAGPVGGAEVLTLQP